MHQPDVRIEHFDMQPRPLARQHADTGRARLRPWRLDDRPRLLLDDRIGFAPQALDEAPVHEAFGFQARRGT